MSIDELREKGHGGCDTAKEAFDELCAMVDALHVSLFRFVLNYWVQIYSDQHVRIYHIKNFFIG